MPLLKNTLLFENSLFNETCVWWPLGIDSPKVHGQSTDVPCIFNWPMDVPWMFYGCMLNIVNAPCFRWAFCGHPMVDGHSMYVVWTFDACSADILCKLHVPSIDAVWMFMDPWMDVPWTLYECFVDIWLMFHGHSMYVFCTSCGNLWTSDGCLIGAL